MTIRQPWYSKQKKAWYVYVDSVGGSRRPIRLSKDRDEAFAKWAKTSPSDESEKTKVDANDVPASLNECIDRRFRQFARIFLIVELLAPLRRGATLVELNSDVSDELGRYCERTIRRDLSFLESLGVVEAVCGDGQVRYRWRDCSIRSVIAERMSSMVADCTSSEVM